MYYAELVEAGGRVPAALEVALRRDLAAVLERCRSEEPGGVTCSGGAD